MCSNRNSRRACQLLALLALTTSGCTLRQLCGWATAETYSSPVERHEVDDRMDQHWGKE